MPFNTQCLVCHSSDISFFKKLKDHRISEEHFEMSICNNCDFKFVSDPPLEEEVGRYYKSDNYISHSDTKEGLINKLYHQARQIMLKRKLSLVREFTDDKRLLDIGCGTGYFLDYMKRNGYDTLGIETDEESRNYGINKFNLEVHPNDYFLGGEIEQKFGTISMWHVLEHLYHPRDYMRRITQLLDDNGIVLIAVPNIDCWEAGHYDYYWDGLEAPRHLWHFTPSTLTKFANDTGFDVVTMRRLPFDPFYSSILSEGYKDSMLQMLRGGIVGLLSFLNSLRDVKKSSSLVYVLRKKI